MCAQGEPQVTLSLLTELSTARELVDFYEFMELQADRAQPAQVLSAIRHLYVWLMAWGELAQDILGVIEKHADTSSKEVAELKAASNATKEALTCFKDLVDNYN